MEEYTAGEKIFAFHQGLIYEAKVLKVELRADTEKARIGAQKPFYYIHYQGWKDRWDEWVEDDRILKHTPANNQLRIEQNDVVKQKRKKATKSKSAQTRKRRKIAPPKTIFSLELPLSLKCILTSELSLINMKMLVPIPKEPSVETILQEFTETLRPNAPSGYFDEVVQGVQLYFEKALGTLLLYSFERLQYSEVLKKNKKKKVSQIYGAEHLLRLFVILPELMADVEIEDQTKKVIKERMEGIINFLDENRDRMFVDKKDYLSANPLYIRKHNS